MLGHFNGNDWNEVKNCLQSDLDVYINGGKKYNLVLNAAKSKARLICNSAIRHITGNPAPFNAVNRHITFVLGYCYLGCVIDAELTLTFN